MQTKMLKDNPVRKKRATRKRAGRLWQHNLSARSNQDIQRAYEESAMKKIVSLLCRRVSVANDKGKHYHRSSTRYSTPPGKHFIVIFKNFASVSSISRNAISCLGRQDSWFILSR